ncbi:Oidioi.mRNA.OKI2018_I69.chr2.g4774.t1.cds [Oikopleura dioica]|uniref:Oidioi.mRNA.OKI2018_I69.chr2.g4774.t1.cds n=1 Tax=Oikopleura dioica TaxID=34765 RepID=A0ABN7SY45_OIKDI|nr:Oidioi.mRNA.OKI2018_I69.chr2.g4774.t1.cds [Oikopleura dioica]
MKIFSLLLAVLLTEASGKASEEKFKLSEDCIHKHPNHQLPNIAEILTLTSNQTLLVRKNRPKEFRGDTKLSSDQKKSFAKLLKSASSSCQFTSKDKLFAFVQSANGNDQIWLLEHDKKREKRIKMAKKSIHYEIKKPKKVQTLENRSRVTFRIPITPLDGNTAKLGKNFQPFMLDSRATNSHCFENPIWKATTKKVTKKYIEYSIKSFNEDCHGAGFDFKFFSSSGPIEKLIKLESKATQETCSNNFDLITRLDKSSSASYVFKRDVQKPHEDWCNAGQECLENGGQICFNKKLQEAKCECPSGREGKCCQQLVDIVRNTTPTTPVPAITTQWAAIGLSIFIITVMLFGLVVYQCFNQRRQTQRRNFSRKAKSHTTGIVAPLPRRPSQAVSGMTQSSRHDDVLSNSNSNGTGNGFLHESLNHGDFDKTIRKPNWYGNKPSHMPGSGMNNGLFHPNQSVVSDETTLPNISQIQQDQNQSRSRKPLIYAPSEGDIDDKENML